MNENVKITILCEDQAKMGYKDKIFLAQHGFCAFIEADCKILFDTNRGLVIVSGCSHAGICNIVEYARKVTGQDRLHAVLGGFHLLADPLQLEKTIAYFKANRVEHLYPMHCTDLPALTRFYKEFGIEKLCAGDSIAIDNG